MLRAANIFPRNRGEDRPFGMVDVGSGNINELMQQVGGFANSMKDKDAQRMREMMVFEKGLNRPMPQHQIQRPQNVVMGRQAGPSMQERFQEEERVGKENAYKSREALLGRQGALENALAVDKQGNAADMARTMAEIGGRETVAKMNKEMTVKAADDARADKATEAARARVEKGPLVNVADPDDPSKTISVRHNPATNKYERVKIDEDQAGTGYKQGTLPKPVANPGQDPTKLAAIRESAQSALAELDQLLDQQGEGELMPHTADAVGKSRIPGAIADKLGLGSFTPSTTKGSAGIKSLSAKLVLETIGRMKAQSRTGATGFGALNLKELAVLENSASKLDAKDVRDEDYRDELRRIRSRLNMILQDAPGNSPDPKDKDSKNKKPTADDFLKKHGY